MSATQSEPQESKAKQNPTEYVVLKKATVQGTTTASGGNLSPADDKTWTEVGRAYGVNAQAAITKALGDKKAEGTYIAVPARSWKPLTPKVETVERVRWS